MEELSEEERKALRGSKFAPLPSLPPPSQPRLAHPGGASTTNKAAALAKFLERKLQDPHGLGSINPELAELAVRNAKDSVASSGSGRSVKHVDTFDDAEDSFDDKDDEDCALKIHERNVKEKNVKEKRKKKKKMKKDGAKSKRRKVIDIGNIKVDKKKKKKLKS